MKRIYLLLITATFSILCFGQTEGVSKIYAYKQKVMPGIARVDQNGREVQRKPQYNYSIYLVSTTKVTAVEIWIDGQAYTPIVNTVSSTPVEYNHPQTNQGPIILVPKTTRNVLQLSTSLNKVQKPTTKGKMLSSKNDLVIIYKGAGKLYYKTVSKISELEALHMQ